MALVNEHFLKLPDSYLFSDIAKKINTFKVTHPKDKVISLGIGDVTRPLPKWRLGIHSEDMVLNKDMVF